MAIGTFTDLDVTENYADNTRLTQAQLNAAMASIETYVNTTTMRNLEQLSKDCFGDANYTFDSDGAANLTNTLFDKQTNTATYNGGDIAVGVAADGAWAAVDAVNAIVTITPEIAGKYRAVFNFTHRATTTATTEGDIDMGFRVTDGTTASPAINSGFRVPATAGGSGICINPVSVSFLFTWANTNARTITLQKYVRSVNDISANVVNAAAATGELYAVVEKV